MSAPKPAGCPAWCNSDHARTPLHRVNIDEVSRVAGDIEVEVNLAQDEHGPFVQVITTDYSIPENGEWQRTMATRVPIDVAATWGHLTEHLDVRGAVEVGRLLFYATDLYRAHQACGYDWCVTDHAEPGWETVHRGTAIRLTALTVTPMLRDDPSSLNPEDEHEAFVRLAFDSGMIHELHPRWSADYADILAGIDIGEADQLVEVLRSAAAKLGVPR